MNKICRWRGLPLPIPILTKDLEEYQGSPHSLEPSHTKVDGPSISSSRINSTRNHGFSNQRRWDYLKQNSLNMNLDRGMEDTRQTLDLRRSSSVYRKNEFDDQTAELCLKESEDLETYEEKFDRWKYFFNEKPLMRCLDKGDEDHLMGELLFERLKKEVQQAAEDVAHRRFRGEFQSRAWWDNIRIDLKVPDEEIYHDCPYEEEDRTKELEPFRLGSKHISRWWKGNLLVVRRFKLPKVKKVP